MWQVSSRCHYCEALPSEPLNFRLVGTCGFDPRTRRGHAHTLLLEVRSARLGQMVSFRINASNVIIFMFVFLAWINNFLMLFNKNNRLLHFHPLKRSTFLSMMSDGGHISPCWWGGRKCGQESWVRRFSPSCSGVSPAGFESHCPAQRSGLQCIRKGLPGQHGTSPHQEQPLLAAWCTPRSNILELNDRICVLQPCPSWF